MQSLYGIVDLFVVGLYNGSSTTTAVSIGSQVIHMLTLIIVGITMGTTVRIGQAVGARKQEEVSKTIGTTIYLFVLVSLVFVVVLFLLTKNIVSLMLTPTEAYNETVSYLKICFLGIPFITAYNVASSIYRGIGDSEHPMYFVAIACVINIVLDFVLVGTFSLGANGAALATVIGQAVSSVIAFIIMIRKNLGFSLSLKNIKMDKGVLADILKVGIPISLQDGFIQVAFIIITIIANSRGIVVATSVGIVEKIISFMFLVPSAFLSAISTVTAQNVGAGKIDRARKALLVGLGITVVYGLILTIYCQVLPQSLVGLFTKDVEVLAAGSTYLMAYVFDCMFAGIHFCFSGYFCGNQKSGISFLHNIISIILVRIPGAYFASKMFPSTLYPMGWAAPLGSLLSALICVGFFIYEKKSEKRCITD